MAIGSRSVGAVSAQGRPPTGIAEDLGEEESRPEPIGKSGAGP
jgi:hypothetical protein